jgi:hypothetical protein
MDSQTQTVLQRKARTELERLLADGNTAQKIAKRARIVLMSADGHGVMAMREVGVSKTTVWRWQEYFVEAGVKGRSRGLTAALESPTRLPWFAHFLQRILENSPQVMELLESNPFPDKPPVYVRALYYDYTYGSTTDKENGVWWNRQLLGLYFPVVSLSGPQF